MRNISELTHGNIRKSRVLQYAIFHDDDFSELTASYTEYEKYVMKLPFKGLSEVWPYLHDASIWFSRDKNDVFMRFWTDYYEDEIGIVSGVFRFSAAKMFGSQRVAKNGHIEKYNKPLTNLSLSYEEFYRINDDYYITVLVLDHSWPRYKTGFSGPMITIRFKDLVIESNI